MMADDSERSWISSEGAAALLLRWGLGVLFFIAGLGKFLAPGGPSAVAEKILEGFKNTYLPEFTTSTFLHVLPYMEITVGAALLIGIFSREALIACGLLLLALTFGKAVQMDAPVVASNLNYVFVTAVALWFSARDNRYSLDRLLGTK